MSSCVGYREREGGGRWEVGGGEREEGGGRWGEGRWEVGWGGRWEVGWEMCREGEKSFG